LKGTALDKFLLQKKGKRWDGVPVPKVSVKDLKQDSFEFFRKRAFKSQRIHLVLPVTRANPSQNQKS
jgi:ATP-dependent DNA helicase RecG